MKTINASAAPKRGTIATLGIGTALLCATLTVSGCGGGSPSPASQTPPSPQITARNAGSFTLDTDDYGLANPNYLSATRSSLGLVMRAAIASSMTDPAYRTVFRIDLPSGSVAAGTYALGGAAVANAFPGGLYFFDGHASTLLKTVGGTITFLPGTSSPGEPVSGSFSALVEDGNDAASPKPNYRICADFSFSLDGFGPIVGAPLPVPAIATSSYEKNCAGCHSLGSVEPAIGSGPDLSLRGGPVNAAFFGAGNTHRNIVLSDGEIAALKVLLNAN